MKSANVRGHICAFVVAGVPNRPAMSPERILEVVLGGEATAISGRTGTVSIQTHYMFIDGKPLITGNHSKTK